MNRSRLNHLIREILSGWLLHFRVSLDTLRDLLHGVRFGGTIESRYRHMGAHATASSFYFVLSRLFTEHPLRETDVLVDVGCGKGRVIHWWLRQGCRNRIVGIELDARIADEARKTFLRYENVAILTGNAVELLPADGTLFYLYNPFNAEVLRMFKDRLKQTCLNRSNLRIFYVNCEFLNVFREDDGWEVRTNCQDFPGDNGWPVEELEFSLSYPIAIIRLKQ